MKTVAEIKAAIERLSPSERAELEALVWPDLEGIEEANPPGIREKLAGAARGRFQPGNRSGIKKILSSLERIRSVNRASSSFAIYRLLSSDGGVLDGGSRFDPATLNWFNSSRSRPI
jgi:hypothetical protein